MYVISSLSLSLYLPKINSLHAFGIYTYMSNERPPDLNSIVLGRTSVQPIDPAPRNQLIGVLLHAMILCCHQLNAGNGKIGPVLVFAREDSPSLVNL